MVGGGDRNLFVRKGGASHRKIGKHWSRLFAYNRLPSTSEL